MMVNNRKLTREEMGTMSPRDFREMVRRREWEPDETCTEYYCRGYTQHNLHVLPLDYAFEFLTFCLRNPRTCYVADVCDVGSPHPTFLAPDGDIRTDCYQYHVFKDGILVDEPYDITEYWRDDLVTFLTSCSMGFEGVLRDKHVKWRTMGTFTSNIRCVPAGRFQCDSLVVSTRLFPSSLDAVRAIQITSQLSISHGYPIHIGDPSEIGIDLMHPDIWNPYPPDAPTPPQQTSEICMSWACGVTPEYAIRVAKPPLAITHRPGSMFISDRRTEEFHSSFTT
jgi:uncharacterized protein YcsI (UPF0317 family)